MPAAMSVRLRLLLGLLLAAAAGAAALQLALRGRGPESVAPPPSEQPRAAAGGAGWTWPDGVPGFRFGVDEARWNRNALRPAEVGGAAARVLAYERYAAGLAAIVARPGPGGRICLGFLLGAAPPRAFCRLGAQKAFLIVSREPQATMTIGVARGDVEQARIAGSRGGEGYLYTRWGITSGWGAFGAGWGPRAVTVVLRDAAGARLASVRIPRAGPRLALLVVR